MNYAEKMVHGQWNPTKKEFSVYLKREVEMAKENIAFLRDSGRPLQIDTLHSSRTFSKAFAWSEGATS